MTDAHVAEIVRKRWLEVLEIPKAAGDDDFFLSGGHSLLAVRLTTALREDLGVRIPVSAIFQTRRLDGYAERVAGLVSAA
jgi:acyl carrier protein